MGGRAIRGVVDKFFELKGEVKASWSFLTINP